MVCHSSAIAGREKIFGGKLRNLLILISLVIAMFSIFYADNIFIFLLCMGKEERFYQEITGQKPGIGTNTNLNMSNPFKQSINLVICLFIFVVPFLYFKIFMFRRNQDMSIQGIL